MKFKYRWLVIRSVALIMVFYISLLALSMPAGAVVDTSRGEGDNFDITGSSSFPMTVGFAFRSSDDSEYNYITATDIGGYGQEYHRTLKGRDTFTYKYDELNENATFHRYLNYNFLPIVQSTQDFFGYVYGFQPLKMSVKSSTGGFPCETIVLRAPDVVVNTYAFEFYKDQGYSLEELAYLGVPVISAPQDIDSSSERYAGTVSVKYDVTDQHGNTKHLDYSYYYDSATTGYLPLLDVNDLKTYYDSIDPIENSSKVLISDWYVYWDVDYYVLTVPDITFTVDAETFTCPDGTTWSAFVENTLLNNGKFRNLDGEIQFEVGTDIWAPISTDGSQANIVEPNGVIQPLAYLTYLTDEDDGIVGTWLFNSSVSAPSTSGRMFLIYSNASSTELCGRLLNSYANYNLCCNKLNAPSSRWYGFQLSSTNFNWSTPDGDFAGTFESLPGRTLIIYDGWLYDEAGLTWLKANATKQSSASMVAVAEEPTSASTDIPTTTATAEWVLTESENKNVVQIGYPLYDTSTGDPEYSDLLNFPDFENFLAGSTIDIPTAGNPGAPGGVEDPSSLTRWLGVAVSGFTDVELWDGFSIGGVLAIIVSFSVVMMFLKVFAGG